MNGWLKKLAANPSIFNRTPLNIVVYPTPAHSEKLPESSITET